ncbi:MAG: CoA-binding protein [Acidobacteriota bacterium]
MTNAESAAPQKDGPRRVAILGASSSRRKFGNKSVRAHAHAGWEVVPVNPKAAASGETIEGLAAVGSLVEAGPLDRISVYLPPAVGLAVLPDMAATGAGEVFFNPGSADRRVLEEARRLGIAAIDACSIVELGLSPSQFPD